MGIADCMFAEKLRFDQEIRRRMKVAIYARVSTDEQTEQNQVNVLEQYAKSQGWEIDGVYLDVGSAFQHSDQKGLNRLLDECQRKQYNKVLVYDVSRLTRQGPLELMLLLKRFVDKGAPVHSYLDSGINFPSEFQPLFVAFAGVMARLYSTQLSARTKAGMARARAQGKHIGRPRKSDIEKEAHRLVLQEMKKKAQTEGKIKRIENMLVELKMEKG
jgi:DNA invertase Pin-like site-specific DNA recombinase